MKISRSQQALTGVAVSIGIIATLMCGLILTLAEAKSPLAGRITPTGVHFPTTLPGQETAAVAQVGITPTIIVIPTTIPATRQPPINSPTASPSSTATATDALKASACQTASGWQTYRVQAGDTLFLIGLKYGLTVTSLMRANCLNDSLIRSGDSLYVPAVTAYPVVGIVPPSTGATAPPPTGTQTATDGACTNPDSVISTPKVGAALRGAITVTGTARLSNFLFYSVEIRREGADEPFANLALEHQQVVNGTLTRFDSSRFPNGEYWLRLVVVDDTSNYPERCSIFVWIDN